MNRCCPHLSPVTWLHVPSNEWPIELNRQMWSDWSEVSDHFQLRWNLNHKCNICFCLSKCQASCDDELMTQMFNTVSKPITLLPYDTVSIQVGKWEPMSLSFWGIFYFYKAADERITLIRYIETKSIFNEWINFACNNKRQIFIHIFHNILSLKYLPVVLLVLWCQEVHGPNLHQIPPCHPSNAKNDMYV